jgi:hypothetical protein
MVPAGEGLRLRPLVPPGALNDERAVIELTPSAAGSSAGTALDHALIIGRTSRERPNMFGVRDARVSRRHVRVDFRDGVFVTALGTNAIGLCQRTGADGSHSADAASACPEQSSFRRTILTAGEKAELRVGDMLQLVIEERNPAHGVSIDFAGNACMYVLEAAAPAPAEDTGDAAERAGAKRRPPADDADEPADDEAMPRPAKVAKAAADEPADEAPPRPAKVAKAGADEPADEAPPRPAKVAKAALQIDDHGHGENRVPQAMGSLDDPICL